MNFPERDFTPATAIPARKVPARKRWRWIAAAVVAGLGVGAVAAYWYFRVCGDCSPILCTDPCTLPTFSQVVEPDLPSIRA